MLPQVLLGDAGYWHQQQMERIVDRGIPVLIPPDAKSRKGTRPGWDGGLYAFMRRVLATEHGGELYGQRQAIIEPVFANTKFNRGIDRFRRRGRAAVRAEWRLITATHNLLKLHRHALSSRLRRRRRGSRRAGRKLTPSKRRPRRRRPAQTYATASGRNGNEAMSHFGQLEPVAPAATPACATTTMQGTSGGAPHPARLARPWHAYGTSRPRAVTGRGHDRRHLVGHRQLILAPSA